MIRTLIIKMKRRVVFDVVAVVSFVTIVTVTVVTIASNTTMKMTQCRILFRRMGTRS